MTNQKNNDEYLTQKTRIHSKGGGICIVSVKRDTDIVIKNPPSRQHGNTIKESATCDNIQNDRKIDELQQELDKVHSQFKTFRNLASNKIQTLKESRDRYSNQSLNNKEKIEKITKYAEHLRHDNYIIYFSLMQLLDSKEIESK